MQIAAYSIRDVCQIAACGRSTVYKAIKAGELCAKKLGRRTIILDEDLKAWLDALPRV